MCWMWTSAARVSPKKSPSQRWRIICSRPANQLARTERFRHVVVRSDLEPHNHTRLVVASGEHQDRHVATRAPGLARSDLAAYADTVHPREHYVQDEEVEGLRLSPQTLQSRLSIPDRPRRHPLARESVLHDVPYRRIVLNYQYLRHPYLPPAALSRPSSRRLLSNAARCSRPSSPSGPCRWPAPTRSPQSYVSRDRNARRRREGRPRLSRPPRPLRLRRRPSGAARSRHRAPRTGQRCRARPGAPARATRGPPERVHLAPPRAGSPQRSP